MNGNDTSHYQSTYEITNLTKNMKFNLKCSEYLVFTLFLIPVTQNINVWTHLALDVIVSTKSSGEKFLSRNSVLKRLFSRKSVILYEQLKRPYSIQHAQNRSKFAVSAGLWFYYCKTIKTSYFTCAYVETKLFILLGKNSTLAVLPFA